MGVGNGLTFLMYLESVEGPCSSSIEIVDLPEPDNEIERLVNMLFSN